MVAHLRSWLPDAFGGIMWVALSNPQDVYKRQDGSKALAILGKEMWENHRVRGARIQGGALMLVDGLEAHDFAQVAAAGVKMIAEVGHGPVKDVHQAARLTRMAKANGFIVPAHSGGPSSRDCAGYDLSLIHI